MAARERAKVEEKAEDQIDKILQPDELPPGVIQLVKVYIAEKRKISVGDKMAGRHGNKGIVARIVPEEDMPFLPDGTPVDIVLNPLGVPSRMNVGQILETHLGWAARILGFEAKTPVFRGADEAEIGVLLRLAGFRWAAEGLRLRHAAPALAPAAITRLVHDLKKVAPKGEHTTLGEAGISMLGARGASAETKEFFNQVREFLVEAAKELAERELAQRRQEVGVPQGRGRERARQGVRQGGEGPREVGRARRRPKRSRPRASRRWPACSAPRARADVDAAADELLRTAGLTPAGKARLRDGRTGQFFEGEVTVGSIYMLKLSHLVDDKIHARSIGPYSLVTQQPLAGKAQFGGQRFGEMEVWALEAYGAAHVLQEMLTVKSDDVNGRSKVYEAIVKGQNLPEPGIPESFNVLVKELQALGLKVTLGYHRIRRRVRGDHMIDFRSGREPKSSSFDYISIRIASPEEIRGPRDPKERERLELQGQRAWWSWGEVTKPETINYRSFKPEKDGLFCERIFGPVKDWECHCGKYKRIRYRGVICDRCGVEVTLSKVRRERMGHIELSVPVAHIWFFKTLPSPMGNLINITLRDLERVIYYSSYIVIEPGKQEVEANQLLDEEEYLALRAKAREEGDTAFRADIGAPAVRELLSRIDVRQLADELRAGVATETSQHRKKQMLKRLKIVDAFLSSGDSGDLPEQPDLDDPGRDPRDPARSPAAGAARRRAVRHERPERPVSAGDQPEQPAHQADPAQGAGGHPPEREAHAPGGGGRAVRQRAALQGHPRSRQAAAQEPLATCSRASRAGSARTCSASAWTTPAARSSWWARSSACTSAACPRRWRSSCSSRSSSTSWSRRASPRRSSAPRRSWSARAPRCTRSWRRSSRTTRCS